MPHVFLYVALEDESRATAEPAVRVYVDGIYIGRSVGALHYGVKT